MTTLGVDDRTYDRIRWRARRGLLENDILLGRFFDTELMRLTADELKALDEILRFEDNDLLDMLMGRKTCEDGRLAPLIARIRQA